MSYLVYDDKTLVLNVEGLDQISLDRKTLKKCDAKVEKGTKVDFLHILGIYTVNKQSYIGLSTSVETVSEFWDIVKLGGFKVIKLSEGSPDPDCVDILMQGFGLGPLYMSPTHDLTLSAAAQAQHKPPEGSFLWNLKPLMKLCEITQVYTDDPRIPIGTPVIMGFVGVKKTDKYTYALISRRSMMRVGTRLWTRGAEKDGQTANFVETEQIVAFPNTTYSLVQIRGSVPMVWSQYPNLSRLPPLKLESESECQQALHNHFAAINERYGPVTVVSLTDDKGREKEITNRYNTLGGKEPNVTFQYWDFHHECAKLHYENIDKLIALIQPKIDEIGFSIIKDGNVEKSQTGVVRTNCIDCLDRTNVVQSVIARQALERQLKIEGIEQLDCLDIFRNIWTDNADAISLQYAGTPALKTDYTRTGKRTFQGLLDDGKNAIIRYYVNTCTDGTRQDAYDVIVQSSDCDGYTKGNNFFTILYLCLLLLITFAMNYIKKGKKAAFEQLKQDRRRVVNYPSIQDVGLGKK